MKKKLKITTGLLFMTLIIINISLININEKGNLTLKGLSVLAKSDKEVCGGGGGGHAFCLNRPSDNWGVCMTLSYQEACCVETSFQNLDCYNVRVDS